MKKTLFLFQVLFIAFSVAWTRGPVKHVDTYKVDTKLSKLEWYAEKVTGKHNGLISLQSGSIMSNHGKLTGTFIIDMTTIVVSDLTGEKKGKLEGHLKSDDFFGVAKHPTSKFEIVSVAPRSEVKAGEPNFNVTGKLTIKDITKDISFPALIQFDGPKVTAKGDVKVDRTQFDVRYGSAKFFDDIGDKAIYDDFLLKMDIVANM